MNLNGFVDSIAEIDNVLGKQDLVEMFLKDYVPIVNPILYWTSAYKISQKDFEYKGVESAYLIALPEFSQKLSDLLSDGEHEANKYVLFGLQWMLMRMHIMFQKGFFERDVEDVISEIESTLDTYGAPYSIEYFRDLHKLGYLPICVKALPEGTLLPENVPMFTVENTVSGYGWLAKYLECGMSSDLRKQVTVATIAHKYNTVIQEYLDKTSVGQDASEHLSNLSSRTQVGFESGAITGVGFMLSSKLSDNLAGLWGAKSFYMSKESVDDVLVATKPMIDRTVIEVAVASIIKEKSLLGETVDQSEAESLYLKYILTEKYKSGDLAYMADSLNLWDFISKIQSVSGHLWERDGDFIVACHKGNAIRVLSGYRILDIDANQSLKGRFQTLEQLKYNTHMWWSPEIEAVKFKGVYYNLNPSFYDNGVVESFAEVEMSREEAVGLVEVLYLSLGGSVNEKGYFELNSKTRVMFTENVSVNCVREILQRLEEKKFSASSVIFGVDDITMNTSVNHLGVAVKPSHATLLLDNERVDVIVPQKVSGGSMALSGFITAKYGFYGDILVSSNVTRDEMEDSILEDLYVNGVFHNFVDVKSVRQSLWNPVYLIPEEEQPEPEGEVVVDEKAIQGVEDDNSKEE